MVDGGSPVSGAWTDTAAFVGAIAVAAVVCPYAVVVPNWNDTLAGAPSGVTAPVSVAVVVVRPVARPVVGVSTSYACPNSARGVVPLVYRKNGVFLELEIEVW